MQISQDRPSDFVIWAILSLVPNFLIQQQREILESREMHIRVKLLEIVQQMIKCRVMALETFLCGVSAQQTASTEDLVTVGRRQDALESEYSAIKAALSEIRRDLLGRHSVYESMNWAEHELTELVAEVQSIGLASEAVLETISR
jgi:phage-related minor tail protein